MNLKIHGRGAFCLNCRGYCPNRPYHFFRLDPYRYLTSLNCTGRPASLVSPLTDDCQRCGGSPCGRAAQKPSGQGRQLHPQPLAATEPLPAGSRAGAIQQLGGDRQFVNSPLGARIGSALAARKLAHALRPSSRPSKPAAGSAFRFATTWALSFRA